jgi:ABC-type multidrug transport system permease subunit
MAKNPYTDMGIKELGQVYITTKYSYGKISGDLLEEINRRGGEADFNLQLQQDKILDIEKARISNELAGLIGTDGDASLAKTLIHSELLSEQELAKYIDSVSRKLSKEKFNKTINSNTLLGGLIGMVIATFLSFVLCSIQIVYLGNIFYFSLIINFILALVCLAIITKKNAGNIIVFLAAIVAVVLGPVIAIIVFSN